MPKESLSPALLPHSRVIKKLPKQLFSDVCVSASLGNTEDEADTEFVSLILSGTFLGACTACSEVPHTVRRGHNNMTKIKNKTTTKTKPLYIEFSVRVVLSVGTKHFSSLQIKIVSMHLDKPICAPSCL